jgi:hypothetical protein
LSQNKDIAKLIFARGKVKEAMISKYKVLGSETYICEGKSSSQSHTPS